VLPGGLGVVESALIVVFSSAGLAVPVAGAVVLAYRLLSYWLVMVIGVPLWLLLNRRDVLAPRTGRPDHPAGPTAAVPMAGSQPNATGAS
jgi:uncharacterized membrane protein YbhN (UPF0104 family)